MDQQFGQRPFRLDGRCKRRDLALEARAEAA